MAEPGDLFADPAAVDLQFAFTGTARSDTAGQTRQGKALADQPGGLVAELCELDLQSALGSARTLRKDIKD